MQVPDTKYEQAAQNPVHEEQVAHSETQQAAATNRTEQRDTPQERPENMGLLVGANERKSLQIKGMETKGIEPSFRRCDRRVLPLHHVPGTEIRRYCSGWRRRVKRCLSALGKITEGTSELPFLEADDAIHGLAPVLFQRVGRIAEGHQLDHRHVFRDADD